MAKIENIVLSCDNLSKKYQNGQIETKVLDRINLTFHENSINLIYGKSGSGKTTLLNLLAALDNPTGGEIIFDGKCYGKMAEKELAKLRGENFGFVFQSYHLIPRISVKENINCPAYINGKKIDEKHYQFLLENLGIKALEDKMPNQLSGGEQQRVAIARVMILKPKIVFADEPTGNLDSENTNLITGLFKKLNEEYSTTFIIVTHEIGLIEKCDQIIRIKDGGISGK